MASIQKANTNILLESKVNYNRNLPIVNCKYARESKNDNSSAWVMRCFIKLQLVLTTYIHLCKNQLSHMPPATGEARQLLSL